MISMETAVVAALLPLAILTTIVATTKAIFMRIEDDFEIKTEPSNNWFNPIKVLILFFAEPEINIIKLKEDLTEHFSEKEQKVGFDKAQGFLKSEKASALKAQAKTIRHDLRSPLAALNSVIDALKIPDDLIVRTLKSATRRIAEIIEDLEEVGDEKKQKLQFAILEEVFHETFSSFQQKNQSGRHVNLRFDHSNLSPVLIPKQKFAEKLEDFLNNLDAHLDAAAKISIEVTNDSQDCRIDIFMISGKHNIGREVFTSFAKFLSSINGSLHPAWNVRLPLQIRIPLFDVGVKFVGPAILKDIVLIDDDTQASRSFENWKVNILESVLTFEDAKIVLSKRYEGTPLFLVDYRLNDNKFGTDLIPNSANKDQCVLCSFDYDSDEFLGKAKSLGVPVMVKTLISSLLYGEDKTKDEATKARTVKNPAHSDQTAVERA